jgi:hypothetical protein
MKFQSMFHFLGGFVVLVLALSMGSSTSSAQSADSEQISSLMLQAKSHAMHAEDDAATLDSYARSKLTWQSHASQLEKIKVHINELGKLNKQLGDVRNEGSPWQQTAIDQVDVRLRELADLLTRTINHMNDHPSQIHMLPYREYVKANYQLTSRITEMINDFVDYDQAKSTAETLEQKLELPAAQGAD